MSCLLWPSLCIDKTRGSEKSYQGCIADGACTCYDYCLPSKHQWCQCINYKVHHYITALLALLSTSFMIHKCRHDVVCITTRVLFCHHLATRRHDCSEKTLLVAFFNGLCSKSQLLLCGGEFSDQSFADTHTLELTSLYAGQQLLNCISLNCQQ